MSQKHENFATLPFIFVYKVGFLVKLSNKVIKPENGLKELKFNFRLLNSIFNFRKNKELRFFKTPFRFS